MGAVVGPSNDAPEERCLTRMPNIPHTDGMTTTPPGRKHTIVVLLDAPSATDLLIDESIEGDIVVNCEWAGSKIGLTNFDGALNFCPYCGDVVTR